MRLSIVIPAYNEAATVGRMIALVAAVDLPGMEKEIICINDGSTDGGGDGRGGGGTRAALDAAAEATPSLRVIHFEHNRGKGAALRAGFAAATGDIVLVQDADLEYNPADYARLLEPMLDGRADVVFGSRFIGGESHRVLYFWHSVGNRILTLASNAVTNLNLTDMEVGYKVFKREIIKSITIEEDRFGFEPEITAKVAKLRCRIYEVGISYSGRTYEEGKKISWEDGLHALWCIVKYGLLR